MSVAQGYKANSFWFLVGVAAVTLTVGIAWGVFGREVGAGALGLALLAGGAFVTQQIRSSLRGI